MENLIKLHKGRFAYDRTSCRQPLANQVWMRWLARPSATAHRILHMAVSWLLLSVRDAIPNPQSLATAAFTILRLCLIKIGARITETATRVRIAFVATRPEADLFAGLVRGFLPAGLTDGACVPNSPPPANPQRLSHPFLPRDDIGASDHSAQQRSRLSNR
jgi:hypothetical protein